MTIGFGRVVKEVYLAAYESGNRNTVNSFKDLVTFTKMSHELAKLNQLMN